jgi:hypothetical protein
MKEKRPAHKAQVVVRKAIPPVASQQPKSVPASAPVHQPKPGLASVPMTKAPKVHSSLVFRKATVAPVNNESLRAKLKELQTTPTFQK